MNLWNDKLEAYRDVCRRIMENKENAPDVFATFFLDEQEQDADTKRREELSALFVERAEIRAWLDGYRGCALAMGNKEFFNESWDLLEDIKHGR